MIGQSSRLQRRHWAQAAALSIGLHGAAIAGFVYDPLQRLPSPGNTQPPQISVETLIPEGGSDGGTDSGDEGMAAETPPATAAVEPPQHPPAPEIPSHPQTRIVTGTSEWAVVTRPMPNLPANPQAVALPDPERPDLPDQGPDATGPDGAPLDPRLAELVVHIRQSLDQSCLLALPQLIGQNELQLTVLADDDRRIATFAEELSHALESPLPEQRVLLDRRQCPGLTFARRAQHYPIFGLGVQLQADEIDSGGSLVGRIANGAGHYNTLLLVDDNGVVQDLRRFLIVQGGEVAFDIPMARVGATRDTSQLLIAIATPGRIESVTANAGRLASDFFPALIAELDDSALIGLGSVYVR